MDGQVEQKEPKLSQEHYNALQKCQTWQSRSWFQLLLYVFVISVILIIYSSYISAFTYAAMQGYWKYSDGVYILIDGERLQIVHFNESDQEIIHDDDGINYTCRSLWSLWAFPTLSSYALRMTIKNEKIIESLGLFDEKKVNLYLMPALGIMQIIRADGRVISLIKDNEMSIEYLAL